MAEVAEAMVAAMAQILARLILARLTLNAQVDPNEVSDLEDGAAALVSSGKSASFTGDE
jgi:hypothetical protein